MCGLSLIEECACLLVDLCCGLHRVVGVFLFVSLGAADSPYAVLARRCLRLLARCWFVVDLCLIFCIVLVKLRVEGYGKKTIVGYKRTTEMQTDQTSEISY